MFAPFGECFFGVFCERQHVIGGLHPAVYSGVGVIQKLVELYLLLVHYRFLSRKLLLADLSGCTHIDERVELSHARIIVFLLVGEDRVTISGLATVLVLKPFHCPALKFFWWSHPRERFGDLLLKLFYFDALLGAWTLSLGAVVVHVTVDVAIFIALGLVLGRYHATAGAATDHAGVRKCVRLGFWLAPSAEERLHTVVFLTRDHRFVLALVPVARSGRPFKPAVVERVVEYAVETAPCEFFETPLVYRDLMHARRGKGSAHHGSLKVYGGIKRNQGYPTSG
ncbi:hypothetical protein A3C18_00120 [Candidatus Kaiserbacteria bacterium RIFCSPHIGHO2_02_FULL_54_11b]|uniref:Uncharacterized protein n=1 Tax=Candidatus Kaiserbacteria bacterium RIFCSPHIGHO2_02_FULL_54_11b TaxID=1798494 RepID=A0A1F6DTE9_9BACT|nr:MAG: hypothetical protein A3C18_00120 [Candidatus Kaiserbacteria bacterium RIFCSPHIGHO2_02_FULL_54_11b]